MLPLKKFVLRLLAWIIFLVPVGYVGYISDVVIHEVVGHGLTAWALGGTFSGFAVFPDGMGWATASSPDHNNLVLAGGVVVSIIFGLMLLFLACLTSHPLKRAAVLVFAACLLEDALPYGFWNCVFVRPPGDFGRILLDLDNEPLRWVLVILFGGGYLVSVIALSVLIFRSLESNFGPFGRHRARLIAWLLFGIGGGLAWFAFDWNQVVRDIGRLPQYVGAGLQLAVAPLLVVLARRNVARIEMTRGVWTIAMAAAWAACLVLILALVLWLRHGIYW